MLLRRSTTVPFASLTSAITVNRMWYCFVFLSSSTASAATGTSVTSVNWRPRVVSWKRNTPAWKSKACGGGVAAAAASSGSSYGSSGAASLAGSAK